jgi:hypothetical protein
MKILEGYIQFNNAIPISMECLGKKYPIKISGINGFIATPRMFEGYNESSEQKLGPLQSPNCGNIKYRNQFYWGSVQSWPNGDSHIVACSIVFPDIDNDSFHEIGNKIVSELEEWRNLLIDNISVMFQEDFRGNTRSIISKSNGLNTFTLFKKTTGSDKEFIPEEYRNETIFIFLKDRLDFNQNLFQKVLDETSQKKKPLLPFYFFLDAERAKFELNYRKSILDLATAVEVCFSLIIVNRLTAQNKLNNYIISKHYSLRQKRELLVAFEVKLPFSDKDYTENLDKIRNRVIHGGYSPTEVEIKKALNITKKTLYELLPDKYEINNI